MGLSPPARPAVAGALLVTLTPDGGLELVRPTIELVTIASIRSFISLTQT